MALCTVTMTPTDRPVEAVVCFCHGFTDNVSYTKMVENQRLVHAGLAFCAIEYEGHGRSDGALGLVPDWEKMIDDVSGYFMHVASKKFPGKKLFLMGESMGGAVAYSIYERIPRMIDGVVLCFPMCKISDDMLPPKWVIDFLEWMLGPSGTCSLLGYLPITPTKERMRDVCQRVLEKRLDSSRVPLVYGRNPRLATARELINVTKRINASMNTFDASFLVVHGKADRVTDPALSQALYEESPSEDKSIILYDDMWHDLTSGESDENIDMVFSDIIRWIKKRV
jgi:acylglycerol lipase